MPKKQYTVHKLTMKSTCGWCWNEFILDEELTPSNMTDFYAYYDWLYDVKDGNDDYEIIDTEILYDADLKKIGWGRWRNFVELYDLYGTGVPTL